MASQSSSEASAACEAKGNASTTDTQRAGEAAAATEMEKIDEIMSVSQNDERDEEIKALIEERRNINKEDN